MIKLACLLFADQLADAALHLGKRNLYTYIYRVYAGGVVITSKRLGAK